MLKMGSLKSFKHGSKWVRFVFSFSHSGECLEQQDRRWKINEEMVVTFR